MGVAEGLVGLVAAIPPEIPGDGELICGDVITEAVDMGGRLLRSNPTSGETWGETDEIGLGEMI